MKQLIANLKMNLTFEEMQNYKYVIENSNVTDLIICPSFIHLEMMQSNKYGLCAQNGYSVDKGAFTGEVSFYQLRNINVNYSLIGHSERRHIFNEDDVLVSKKIDACINNGIKPILCVGETKEEKESGNTLNVIDRQIIDSIFNKNIKDIIIAYEPVWAIGTGLIPTIDDINLVHLHIKELLNKNNINVNVLYGGSVKESNIAEICSLDSVDGVLIGGASNDPNNLLKMYNIIKNM